MLIKLNQRRNVYICLVAFILSACERDQEVDRSVSQQELTQVTEVIVSQSQIVSITKDELATDFEPVSDDVLSDPPPESWLRWRRDNEASGYSPLDQITTSNVNKLKLAWSWAMEAGSTEQEPLVHRGIMYLANPKGVVQALDARTGEMIWEYRRKLPEGSRDTSRNIALYRDKVYLTTTDAFIVALDAKTGGLVWETKTGEPSEGVTYSSGPIAGDGKIFAGQTCWSNITDQACALVAVDAESGEFLWERESVAGPNDPKEHQGTWGEVPYEKRRKASFWLAGSYDSEQKLVFWTTASPYPYPEILKGNTAGGDLLYTNSILAIESATGNIKWHFQMMPRDNFDMDHQDNPILADITINGEHRKIVYVLGKPGMLWAFDRVTGKYIWNKQIVSYQNLYKNIDPGTGAITINESLIPEKIGDENLVCPGMRGGKLFQSKAYNPVTNIIYSPVSNECVNYKVVSLDISNSGTDWSDIKYMKDSNEKVGRLSANSAITGEVKWIYDQRAALGSVLTTAGKLVFVGDLHRYFIALDGLTGDVVWKTPLSAPVTGYPISYAVDGKQYIAVTVGGNTDGTRHLARLYPELKSINGSNVLMVFTLTD